MLNRTGEKGLSMGAEQSTARSMGAEQCTSMQRGASSDIPEQKPVSQFRAPSSHL